ncbi:MAG: monofunctional biosynthetic peptidoglycan transglycosylase [Bacteroidales bacterium]|nr:monofunctional biosynthetic peptidoglycan transglycosylase [Bacteroidales bacterium]
MKRFLRYILIYIPISLILLSIIWVVLLKWVPVYYTPLMAIRSIEYRNDPDFKSTKNWKSLDEISNKMVYAVIASEDNRFEEHNGFDFIEIKNAINDSKKGKRLRGASTISQQTAKNVFLFPGRSWIRKGLECYFTLLIEWIWGKERIMEVYLNVAETGKGLYGVEAAAQKYFKKSASKLNSYESSLIAASLPNPLKRNPAKPTNYMIKRASQIRSLMNKIALPEWK